MKKIIIIFIIAFCLFFTGVFCFSATRDNYAEIWNAWNDYDKYVYIWGLQDGLRERATTTSSVLTHPKSFDDLLTRIFLYKYLGTSEEVNKEIKKIEEQREQAKDIVREFCSPKFDIEVIRSIVTDLYKDPANSYIYERYVLPCFLETQGGAY